MNKISSTQQLLDISYNFVQPLSDETNQDNYITSPTFVNNNFPDNHVASCSTSYYKGDQEIAQLMSLREIDEDEGEEDTFADSGSSYVPSSVSNSDSDNQREEITEEADELNNCKKGKKRIRNETSWQRNVRKKKRMAGEKYKSSKSKKIIKEKKVKESCRNCRLKCNEKIAGPERNRINQEFWNQETTIDQKRQFLCSCLEQTSIERKRERTGSRSGKRQYNLKYFFTLNGNKYQVCKFFFCVHWTYLKHLLGVHFKNANPVELLNVIKEESSHQLTRLVMM